MADMNDRQRRFAEAYLRLGDAARAAREAGYSPRYGAKALRTRAVAGWLQARRPGGPGARAEPAAPAEPARAAIPVAHAQAVRAKAHDAAAGPGHPAAGAAVVADAAVCAGGGAPVEPAAPSDGRVATAREVLEYLTDVMRGDAEPEGRSGSATPRMKAAELLGKRLGVFNETPAVPAMPVIVDDIPAGGDG